MYYKYYLNPDAQNTPRKEHEVHKEGCYYLSKIRYPIYLGEFTNCADALREAKRLYPTYTIDGCYHCCLPCHTM